MLALRKAPQDFVGTFFHLGELACSCNSAIPNPSVERLQPDVQWRTGQLAQELFDIMFEVAKAFFDDASHGRSVAPHDPPRQRVARVISVDRRPAVSLPFSYLQRKRARIGLKAP
jgi:hypothetical protein